MSEGFRKDLQFKNSYTLKGIFDQGKISLRVVFRAKSSLDGAIAGHVNRRDQVLSNGLLFVY